MTASSTQYALHEAGVATAEDVIFRDSVLLNEQLFLGVCADRSEYFSTFSLRNHDGSLSDATSSSMNQNLLASDDATRGYQGIVSREEDEGHRCGFLKAHSQWNTHGALGWKADVCGESVTRCRHHSVADFDIRDSGSNTSDDTRGVNT